MITYATTGSVINRPVTMPINARCKNVCVIGLEENQGLFLLDFDQSDDEKCAACARNQVYCHHKTSTLSMQGRRSQMSMDLGLERLAILPRNQIELQKRR